ncbi:unnamed protein product [Gordionus sp. m RMFG-2023]|uniref:ubiquitin carboxyl-terminal hydrolase 15-like isoform X2 n=1 Tax=Gordionus sp. m RMFG-2023 TaxID=3053472 RepID=UPI0030E08F0E
MARSTKIKENRIDCKSFFQKSLKKDGEIWYLISTEWLAKLYSFLDENKNLFEQVLGPIDNSSLLTDDTNHILKPGLIEDVDFKIINQEDWEKMRDHFGILNDSHAISREVVDLNKHKGIESKHNLFLDIYPLKLKMFKFPNIDILATNSYNKNDLISKMEQDLKTFFELPNETEVRLWMSNKCNVIKTYIPLPNIKQTMYDAGITSDHYIIMETYRKGAEVWPLTVKHPLNEECTYQFKAYSDKEHQQNLPRFPKIIPGLSGLVNLGNTCFMNSALQCLSNVPPLTEYFVSKKFLQDINANNPLGMKGQIAKAYAKLMESIWTNKHISFSLRTFKDIVGEFAPTFSGFQQHDSQELLIFLLDGLHEDLNRIKKKPYIDLKEAEGRKDEDVAREAWKHFKMRNDSIVVDTFYGQLKSTLICPVCNKVSVTFDPFSTLSVPLPYKKERAIKIKLVLYDSERPPAQCRINVPKDGTISDLCAVITEHTKIPANQILVAKITLNRFHKVFNLSDSVTLINSNDDIVIYEFPTDFQDKSLICLPVYQQIDKSMELKGNESDTNAKILPTSFFLPPFIIMVPSDKSNENNIRKILMDRMKRYVSKPRRDYEWWKQDPLNNIPISDLHMPPNMFTIKVGDIYGNVDFTLVESSDLAKMDTQVNIKLGTKVEPSSFIILDWHPLAKAKFVDIETAMDVVILDNLFNTPYSIKTCYPYPDPHTKKSWELSECLDSFVSVERLSEQDSWYCPHCKKHQQATKKFDLWKLPPILLIHLKRFYYNRFFREKINIAIDFPINNLDLSSYVKDPEHRKHSIYNLIGVSNHYGELGYGHYTAYAKNYFDKEWYNFDDSSVSKVKESVVMSKAAYVLFYQREGTENIFFSPSSISSSTYSSFVSPFTYNLHNNLECSNNSGSDSYNNNGNGTNYNTRSSNQKNFQTLTNMELNDPTDDDNKLGIKNETSCLDDENEGSIDDTDIEEEAGDTSNKLNIVEKKLYVKKFYNTRLGAKNIEQEPIGNEIEIRAGNIIDITGNFMDST